MLFYFPTPNGDCCTFFSSIIEPFKLLLLSQIYRIFPGKSGAKDDRNVGIHCVTMNCGGQSPGSLEDLLPIFEVRD